MPNTELDKRFRNKRDDLLKLVAIISMVFDHIGAVLYPRLFLRIIGRLAFPIFAFLIVEGYERTRDPKKYLLRLFLWGMVSQIPFSLAFQTPFYYFNIYISLLLGLLLVVFYDSGFSALSKTSQISETYDPTDIDKAKSNSDSLTEILNGLEPPKNIKGFILILILVFALRYDYSIFGPFMIFGLFLFRKNKLGVLLILVSINFGISFFDSISSNSIELIQLFGILTFPFLIMPSSYGLSLKRINKHVFFAFYPFHLMLIYLIKVSLL